MNDCVYNIFAEFIIYVTVQCLASWRFVQRHQHQHQAHLLGCRTVCWPHFVGLNTTTNGLSFKQHICWISHTCHCTVFSIGNSCFSASALASATPIVLPNGKCLNVWSSPGFCPPRGRTRTETGSYILYILKRLDQTLQDWSMSVAVSLQTGQNQYTTGPDPRLVQPTVTNTY